MQTFNFILFQDAVTLLNHFVSSNSTFNDVRGPATKLCADFLTNGGMEGGTMCPGIVDAYGPPVSIFGIFVYKVTTIFIMGKLVFSAQLLLSQQITSLHIHSNFSKECTCFTKLGFIIDKQAISIVKSLLFLAHIRRTAEISIQRLTFQIMYILDQQIFDPKSVCETLNYCQKEFEPLSIQPILRVNRRHDTQREYTRRSSGQPIRILQLADIHIDPDYAEVSAKVLTCLQELYKVFTVSNIVLFFGDYS